VSGVDGGQVISVGNIVIYRCSMILGLRSGSPEVVWDIDINGKDWWGSGVIDGW